MTYMLEGIAMKEVQKQLARAARQDIEAWHQPMPELDWSRISRPTDGDLAQIITNAIVTEHLRPAIQQDTPAEFISFFIDHVADYARKRRAIATLAMEISADAATAAMAAVEERAKKAGFQDLWVSAAESSVLVQRASNIHGRIEASDLASSLSPQHHAHFLAHYLGWSWAFGCCLIAVLDTEAGGAAPAPDVLALAEKMMRDASREAYIVVRRVEWDAGVPTPDVLRWASARAAQRRFGQPTEEGASHVDEGSGVR